MPPEYHQNQLAALKKHRLLGFDCRSSAPKLHHIHPLRSNPLPAAERGSFGAQKAECPEFRPKMPSPTVTEVTTFTIEESCALSGMCPWACKRRLKLRRLNIQEKPSIVKSLDVQPVLQGHCIVGACSSDCHSEIGYKSVAGSECFVGTT